MVVWVKGESDEWVQGTYQLGYIVVKGGVDGKGKCVEITGSK
jgi:hypothetical protein